ncbi:MAG: hypothetical protein QXS89_07020 [Sulfolobales archaeon]
MEGLGRPGLNARSESSSKISREDLCGFSEECRDLCGDLERECSEILEILENPERRTINRCESCILREYLEEKGFEAMYYKHDDREIMFAKIERVLAELREDGGEIIPLESLREYLEDLENFSIYPSEVAERIRKWIETE